MTSEGDVGAGPDETEVGDLVVVLWGCNVPVILRKVKGEKGEEDRFRFIGETYVYGFMDAEAIVWLMKRRFNERNFLLI